MLAATRQASVLPRSRAGSSSQPQGKGRRGRRVQEEAGPEEGPLDATREGEA